VSTVPATVSAFFPEDTAVQSLNGLQVGFTFTGGLSTQTKTVSGNQASASVQFPDSGSVVATSTVDSPADYFVTDTSGSTTAVGPIQDSTTVTGAETTTQFSSLNLSPTGLVGAGPFHVEVTLSVTLPVFGPVSAGNAVVFTVTPPADSGLSASTYSGSTDAAGLAFANIPASAVARGINTVQAAFAKNGCLGASSSASSTLTLYQKTQLSYVGSSSPVCGAPFSLTAKLSAQPQGSAISNEDINFDFGGAISGDTLTTDGSGQVTFSGVLTDAGTVTATTSFEDDAQSYTNHGGDIPPQAESLSALITVANAVGALTAPVSSPTPFYINAALTVSSTFTRVTAPAGPIGGAKVTFTLVRASDGATFTAFAFTFATGVATTAFPPSALQVVDSYTITASYDGDSCVSMVSSSPVTVQMRQKTSLTLGSITPSCGTPFSFSATLKSNPITDKTKCPKGSAASIAFSVIGVVVAIVAML